jgi:hypothetical protein
MSKSTFQRCYTEIIMPNKDRIESLRLSNPFIVDLIFTSTRIISKFHRLETLLLNNIKSKYLGNILKNLALLPRLFSLSIATVDYIPNKTILYRLIFCLPILKYCKLSYEERVVSEPLLPAVNACSTRGKKRDFRTPSYSLVLPSYFKKILKYGSLAFSPLVQYYRTSGHQ